MHKSLCRIAAFRDSGRCTEPAGSTAFSGAAQCAIVPLPRRPEAAILPLRQSSQKRNVPAKAQGFPAIKTASTDGVQSDRD
jgi:hypothetical protein